VPVPGPGSRGAEGRAIEEVAAALGLAPEEWRPCDRRIAKVDPGVLARARRRPGAARLVLVTAITPTPAGEGKTTTSIGLADGLARLGHAACLALREPSLGPVFGLKGGATGGGRSRLVPADRIDLHFTGDFHAVAAAHNLLAALLDNHLYFGNELRIDPRRVLWPRVLDMNDRALRRVVVGLGGPQDGTPRETGFEITAASEVMAMLCLAEDAADLRARMDRLLVAFAQDGAAVTGKCLNASGAMLALLRDALWPNLVQTREGTPAFVHGGPFANIAHGCSSLLATRTALQLADWVVTEAGFGSELGAEKFFDIKCRAAGLDAAAVVLVATVRALKFHGGSRPGELSRPDPGAVAGGLPNLEQHVENVRRFGKVPVVALNRFASDAAPELDLVRARCDELGVSCALSESFARGGEGALELARCVAEQAERGSPPFRPLYSLADPVVEKIRTVACTLYGARGIELAPGARRDLETLERLGHAGLPVCIAKTPASLSDDPRRRGRPRGFDVSVRAIRIAAGAGFLVVLTGDLLRMPGLPRRPRAESIDLRNGEITGLE
jgi:formate--tetrahydrofolate ligase